MTANGYLPPGQVRRTAGMRMSSTASLTHFMSRSSGHHGPPGSPADYLSSQQSRRVFGGPGVTIVDGVTGPGENGLCGGT
jgi:hypothetical protein